MKGGQEVSIFRALPARTLPHTILCTMPQITILYRTSPTPLLSLANNQISMQGQPIGPLKVFTSQSFIALAQPRGPLLPLHFCQPTINREFYETFQGFALKCFTAMAPDNCSLLSLWGQPRAQMQHVLKGYSGVLLLIFVARVAAALLFLPDGICLGGAVHTGNKGRNTTLCAPIMATNQEQKEPLLTGYGNFSTGFNICERRIFD